MHALASRMGIFNIDWVNTFDKVQKVAGPYGITFRFQWNVVG